MDLTKITETLTELGTTWGLKVLGVLIALFAAKLLASWTRRRIRSTLEKRNFDATLTRFFSNAARYAILTGAVIGCLGVFGIETASFAALIAAGGLAVGLALQGTLANFSSGVMLIIFRPFSVGDVIKVAGLVGTVEEIELFTTELTTPDNRRMIVPNGEIFGAAIENVTFYETRRVDVPVGTDYGADVDETRKVLEAMALKIPGVLEEPAPQIFLAGLGGSSVDWQVRVWCKTSDYWDVFQTCIRDTKAALDAAHIGIPYPQTDVHLDADVVAALTKK